MSRPAPIIQLIAIVALLHSLSAPTARGQQTRPADSTADQPFHSRAFRYNLLIPADWKAMPAEQLDAAARQAVHGGEADVRWDAAFAPASQPAMTPPYVLVQVMPYPEDRQPTDALIKREVGELSSGNIERHADSEVGLTRMLKHARAGTVDYDASRRTFSYTLDIQSPAGPAIHGLGVGHFGRHALVWVLCFARKDDAAVAAPTFARINRSFYFDPSVEYDPTLNASHPHVWWVYAGTAAGVILGIGAMIWLARRRARGDI